MLATHALRHKPARISEPVTFAKDAWILDIKGLAPKETRDVRLVTALAPPPEP